MAYILLRVTRQICMFGMLSLTLGCASSPTEYEKFMGEGFQSFLPNSGARVVVWGNHSGAVMRTLGWLHDHQILGVDPSWIQKELSDPGFAHRTRKEQKEQVLAAAQSVGASLVLFAQVEDNQLGRKFDLMSFGYKRMKIMGVEIRGMRVETGDVVFGAKAWNPKPLVESEQIVQELTTFALQKAWNESDGPLPPQQEVAKQEQQPETVAGATLYSKETLPAFAASNSESDRFLPLQPNVAQQILEQEEVSVASSDSGKLAPTREVSNFEVDRSLLLKPKVAQQTAEQEEVSVASSPLDDISPKPETSKFESDRFLPLQQKVADQESQPEPVVGAKSYSEETSSTHEASQSEILEPSLLEHDDSLGLQMAGGALSLLYTPVKLAYAGLGGFMGGLSYILTAGNKTVAQSVWDASLNGTYFLTAKHLQGEEAIRFKGEPAPMDSIHQARVDRNVGKVAQ